MPRACWFESSLGHQELFLILSPCRWRFLSFKDILFLYCFLLVFRNMKNGQRRRRLIFMTCRAVIEKAYNDLYGVSKASSVSVSYGNNKLNERRLNVKQQALF